MRMSGERVWWAKSKIPAAYLGWSIPITARDSVAGAEWGRKKVVKDGVQEFIVHTFHFSALL